MFSCCFSWRRSIVGDAAVITDGSGNVLSSNEGKGVGLEYDSFGVAMVTSGSAQTPYRPAGLVLDVEGLASSARGRGYLNPSRDLSLEAAVDICPIACAVASVFGVPYGECMSICEGLLHGGKQPSPTPPTSGGGGGGTSPTPQPPMNCPRGMIPIVVNCPKGYISTCVPSNFYQTCLPGCDADGSPDLCKTRLSPPPGKQKQ